MMKTSVLKPMNVSKDVWASPFDQLVDSFFNNAVTHNVNREFYRPQLDVVEKKVTFELTMSLPGLEKEAVTIELKKGVLTISGEKKAEFTEQDDVVHYREINYGKFSRAIHLPESIDAEKIEAEMKNGILSIVVPKSEKETSKIISLK